MGLCASGVLGKSPLITAWDRVSEECALASCGPPFQPEITT